MEDTRTILRELQKLDRTPPSLAIAVDNTFTRAGKDDVLDVLHVDALLHGTIGFLGPRVTIIEERQSAINAQGKIAQTAGLDTTTDSECLTGDNENIARKERVQGGVK